VPEALHGEALIVLDKLEKIGAAGVEKELLTRGIDGTAAMACLNFFSGLTAEESRHPGPIDRLRDFVRSHHAGPPSVSVLDDIVHLSDGTAAHGRIRIDPSLARGLSYYTGAIMEIAVPDLAGSLGGGGRYDNLIGMFLGKDIPGCGFSLGLERIIVVMTERGMFPESVGASSVDVMVTLWDEANRAGALSLATELRRAGLRVDVYPDADRLGKQVKYAASRNIPSVAIVGDDERVSGTVSVKDMRSGAQERVPRADAASFIRNRVERETST
jgi:histidyl-tRNA synthetase